MSKWIPHERRSDEHAGENCEEAESRGDNDCGERHGENLGSLVVSGDGASLTVATRGKASLGHG